jgi:tetratricopeptide (TPR) repeat protein
VVKAPPKLSLPFFYSEDFVGSVFVGRDNELVELHDFLVAGARVAIAAVGMGGVGKTTLARRYVQQQRAEYPGGIWWVTAGQVVTQVVDYARRSVGLEELPTDWTEAQIVQHYLRRWEEKWPEQKLLVIDDVGEYGAIKPFIPAQGTFRLLMTTRVKMQRPVLCLNLEVLKPADALLLLSELMGEDARLIAEAAAAEELCAWLDYLPLGIELVGRYLSETSSSIADLLEQLKEKSLAAKPMLDVPAEMDYGRNVQAAIELSWQAVNAQAQTLVMLLGLFALAPVLPAWVLSAWVSASLPAWDATDLRDCLDRQLVKRSLLKRGEEGYSLHGLVREFLQGKLAASTHAAGLQLGFAQTMTTIAKTIPPTATLSDRARVTAAIPHLEEVAARWTSVLGEDDKIGCCVGLARFYENLNLWAEAQRCWVRSLDISKTELGNRHPSTASSLNDLAGLYRLQGRYKEAKHLLLEALEIRKAELGGYHPDTASSLNDLALLYRLQGWYEEAEPLLLEALEIRRAKLGNCHPDTANSLNNLAGLYRLLSRYKEAEPLYIEALAVWKTKLGDRHPDTASSLNNLALLYYSQGRYEEAEPLYVEALSICKEELGDRHPDTASSLNNLALLYYSQGRYEEAEPLYIEVLAIRKLELGNRHPSIATSLNNLAALYYSQDRHGEAEPIFIEALSICKSELGDHHPSTASSLNSLAGVYKAQGRYEEAEPLYVEALVIRKAALGDRHPSTASSLNNLAALYESQNRYGDAEPLYLQALEIRKAELGDRHPSTAASLNNLAALYDNTNRFSEAAIAISEAVSILEECLGPSHSSTLAAQHKLESIQQKLDNNI